MEKQYSPSELVVINQSPDGVALMTKKAWQAHQDLVLASFKEELQSEEAAQEELDSYLENFEVKTATRKEYNFLIQCCNLEVNETEQIESFVGEMMRF